MQFCSVCMVTLLVRFDFALMQLSSLLGMEEEDDDDDDDTASSSPGSILTASLVLYKVSLSKPVILTVCRDENPAEPHIESCTKLMTNWSRLDTSQDQSFHNFQPISQLPAIPPLSCDHDHFLQLESKRGIRGACCEIVGIL